MEIKNVIICGLGALGATYADKLKNVCSLRILADVERIKKYKKFPPIFNRKILELDYISPKEKFNTDLIIITTKSLGLKSSLEYIKNFVKKDTIIISLINGVSSEEIILSKYPEAKVIKSYFIGHSAMKINNEYFQDGVGKIVCEYNEDLIEFFDKNNIDYEISDEILKSMWIKLGVNIILNQLTAVYKCTVGDLKKHKDYFKGGRPYG